MCANQEFQAFLVPHLSRADRHRIQTRITTETSQTSDQTRSVVRDFPAGEYVNKLAKLSSSYGRLSDEGKTWIAALARNLAAYDVPAQWVNRYTTILVRAIRENASDLRFTQKIHLEEILLRAAEIIQALLETQPGSTTAEVAEVLHESTELSIVRLLTHGELPFQAGQYCSVTTPFSHGQWRDLYIATPPNPNGEIEFHIRRQGTQSRLLTRSQAGDTWQLTPGKGGFRNAATQELSDLSTRDADRIYICDSYGFAPFQSLLLEQLQQGIQRRAHIFVAADYPGQLYALQNLWHYASAAPWMAVTPVARNPKDAWWIDPCTSANPPRGLQLPQVGEAGELVAEFGAWSDRDIFIAGDPDFIQTTRAALHRGGSKDSHILLADSSWSELIPDLPDSVQAESSSNPHAARHRSL